MPGKSNIEWTDATWNPVTGCSKVSQGCKNCYAEAFFARPYPGRKFTDVRTHPERLDWPLRWRGSPQAKAEGRPSRIFVNSMSDLFHEDVPTDFIFQVFLRMWGAPDFVFQILTKRASRMRELVRTWLDIDRKLMGQFAPDALPGGRGIERLGSPVDNVWFGVSIEDQKTADERIPILLQTPAALRWVSYEPALGPVDFSRIRWPQSGAQATYCDALTGSLLRFPLGGPIAHGVCPKLDWIVAGGESGPHARPLRPDWFRSVRDQCQAACVPFFFKQWGAWLPDGQDGAKFTMRQEINAGDQPVYVGKKKAGCLLDGREWKEFPAFADSRS
jgi:protein gp37